MKIFNQTVLFGCAAVSSFYCYADDAEVKQIEASGNLSVVSKYVSRGLTNAPENDDVAVQAALNLAYGNFFCWILGIYAWILLCRSAGASGTSFRQIRA